MTAKKKVLIIINHYLPGYRAGGPVRSTANLISWLNEDFDFSVLTSDRDLGEHVSYRGINQGEWYPVDGADVRYLAPKEKSLLSLKRILQSTPYDMIYLDSILEVLSLKILLLHRLGLLPHKAITITPRGQLKAEARHIKRRKKQLFFFLSKWIGLYKNLVWHVCNIEEQNDTTDFFGVKTVSQMWVGSNLPIRPPIEDQQAATSLVKETGTVRLIFLSRISRTKNLDFALRILAKIEGEIIFDIYGPIEDQAYWKICQNLIAKLPPTVTVNYRGAVNFTEVSGAFSQYHLFFFPTLGESFGHVILEALCSGCLILTSDETPWDDLESAGIGWGLPLNQEERFAAALDEVIEMDQESFDQASGNARDYGLNYVNDSDQVEAMRQFIQDMLEGNPR